MNGKIEKQESSNSTSRRSNQPAWLTVALREMAVKVRDKSFIISTLVTVLILVCSAIVFIWLGGQTDKFKLAVVSEEAAQIASTIETTLDVSNENIEFEVVRKDSDEQARQLVKDDEADAYLAKTKDSTWEFITTGNPNYKVFSMTSQVVSASVVTDLSQKASVPVEQVAKDSTVVAVDIAADEAGTRNPTGVGFIMATIFAMLFMMASIMYGQLIAQSVIEEKQSRIVEILVCAIPVRQLLVGKVAGNTVMAFAQMILLAGTGIVALKLSPAADMFAMISGSIFWFLLFFVVGFLTLACIWAACGAMATRQEDLQYTAQPVTYLLLGAYLVTFVAMGSFRTVASYLPLVSSILMPARLATGEAEWWEAIIALMITCACSAGTIYLGAKIYRKALLQTRGRLTMRQALKITQ